ncbi:DUF2061 domain-containing protein [Pseudotenacibaculum sp. MALMAid0570]|uniref:DUF2061 domain-containing protein n=1 Tax=Pseudotenacibaculum sp. MALMAid0570 TaxID=3143938 RepID=UPI0032DEC673
MLKESKLRSAIKSLTWRFVAILDTILIVLFVTCYFNKCNISDALTVGLVEFLLKFLVYYVHERVWQKIELIKRTAKLRTIVKTLSWRIIATIMTFLIAGVIIDGSNKIALYIAVFEVFTKSLLYYAHERIWLILPLGRVRNLSKKIFYAREHNKT